MAVRSCIGGKIIKKMFKYKCVSGILLIGKYTCEYIKQVHVYIICKRQSLFYFNTILSKNTESNCFIYTASWKEIYIKITHYVYIFITFHQFCFTSKLHTKTWCRNKNLRSISEVKPSRACQYLDEWNIGRNRCLGVCMV